MHTEMIALDAPDGTMPAYLAEPETDEPAPAVVVLIEAFGLVSSIKCVARRFADEGYVTLVPDLFYRELPDNTASYDDIPRGMELQAKLVERGEQFVQDLAVAFDFLDAHPGVREGKIGLTGFCMGGGLTFWAACALPERIAAAAPFYGGGMVFMLDRADRIACPLYMFFGERDPFIPLEQVEEVKTRLRELEKDVRVKVYPGADHGFFNDERSSVYDPIAAADAWQEVCHFFGAHLKGVGEHAS